MTSEDLVEIRQKLVEAIGPNSRTYFIAMKRWFKKKISKDDFDSTARTLFTPENVHLHNEFFLAILTKCHISLSSTLSPPRKRERQPLPDWDKDFHTHMATKLPLEGVPLGRLPPIDAPPEAFHLCSLDGLLPSKEILHARCLLISWENGINTVDPNAVDLIYLSMQQMLKNAIQAILTLKRSFLVRQHPRLAHKFGATRRPIGAVAPSARGRLVGEGVELKRTKLEDVVVSLPAAKISLFDLYQALQYSGGEFLPIGAVRSMLMDRILCQMEHNDLA